jgi:hypothetical protein
MFPTSQFHHNINSKAQSIHPLTTRDYRPGIVTGVEARMARKTGGKPGVLVSITSGFVDDM